MRETNKVYPTKYDLTEGFTNANEGLLKIMNYDFSCAGSNTYKTIRNQCCRCAVVQGTENCGGFARHVGEYALVNDVKICKLEDLMGGRSVFSIGSVILCLVHFKIGGRRGARQ